MENLYFYLLIALFILAIGDLIVGVSNDAVNFLNSAIGSKVISFKNIMIFASIGIALGAISSSGMMEVARKGIFNPEAFYFDEIIYIFMAVMITDILLLDFFNTLGLPTSTTVSIVFELLGASVVMALIKIYNSSKDLTDLTNYINNEKAIQIILGILLSVFIAFSIGALIQWISRFVLSYNLDLKTSWINALVGGVSISSIFGFILIKGIKGTPYAQIEFSFLNNSDISTFIDNHLITVNLFNFISCYLLSYFIIKYLKTDIYKIIIGIGTFALALAFAGNDLVNFIGVPVAAFQSYEAWVVSGIPASDYEMGFLSQKVPAPTFLLLGSGVIMVLTLWFSSKAKKVVKTSLDLSSQHEIKERFKSNILSRFLVRYALNLNSLLRTITPDSLQVKIDNSFKSPKVDKSISIINRPSFDKLRASINLVVAAILISMATSLKLPLSTTYVTFMVTMGTSLADRAWGTESAVYRVSGVLNVIAGWFFTALIAFIVGGTIVFFINLGGPNAIAVILFIVVLTVGKSYLSSRKEEKIIFEENKLIVKNASSYEEVISVSGTNISKVINRTSQIYNSLVEGISKNQLKEFKRINKTIIKLDNEVENLRENIFLFIKNIKDSSIAASKFYISILDEVEDMTKDLQYMIRKCYDHIDNNHNKLKLSQIRNLIEIQNHLNFTLFKASIKVFKKQNDIEDFEKLLVEKNESIKLLDSKIEEQILESKTEDSTPRNTKLYFNILLKTKDLTKSNYRLIENYYYVIKKIKEAII